MSGTGDLKNLLDRLKEEVGTLPEELPRQERPAARMPATAQPAERPVERFMRAHKPEAQREPLPLPGGGNIVWSENKEAMLFGMLAALIAALGGVLSGLDYLVLIGAVVFLLFSFMMLLSLFGYYLNFRRRGPERSGLAERVDALSKKVEMLSTMTASGGGQAYQSAMPERERELEHKVEELRVLVKTLSRAVDQQNR
ncbi:MAG: hypothetical protein A2X35_06155 [Elusimicrobia bacterium GWA2_61_42]|nr:MAG: hypothetical protein A2X35_06155 [Elusimicrobia bacterium GWA2_61_42]OGR78735.1 MAG: hypothetical protein A2X38_04100 [Elusimicrobia bacterium GWC2_61_25]